MSDSDAHIRVVFDCNVFLQGLINAASPSNRCLGIWEENRVTLYTSRPILMEIRSVLLRPELQDKFAALTFDRVAGLFDLLIEKCILVEAVPTQFRFERDIKDEPYLNLAIAVGADLIVTRDNDMLDLMHREDAVSNLFRVSYPRIRIVDPVSFLAVISDLEGDDRLP